MLTAPLRVTIMLMGLILRGVIRLRVKAGDRHKAAEPLCLGVAYCSIWLGRCWAPLLRADRLRHQHLFAALIAVALPALYIMLGAVWLLIKTEGELFQKAAHRGRLAVWLGRISVPIS